MEKQTKANVREFKQEISKNMGDYVDINGKDAVKSVDSYIIELYENILSSGERGAVSVSKKGEDGYTILGSNVYDELSVAKNVYVELDNQSSVEIFVEHQLDTIDWEN